MLLIINNIGKGYSGVRLSVVEQLRAFLNCGLTPHAPRHGSVGYLCVEAHVALTMLGEGYAYWQGVKMAAAEALQASIIFLLLQKQEDYVSMAYNAALKARWIVLKAEYVLAIELLSGCQACDVFDCQQYFAPELRRIIEKLLKQPGHHEEDYLLLPAIEYLRDVIHADDLLNGETR